MNTEQHLCAFEQANLPKPRNEDPARQFSALLQHAIEQNDTTVYNMLMAQSIHPVEWSEFMFNLVVTLSAQKKTITEELVRVLSYCNKPTSILYTQKQRDAG